MHNSFFQIFVFNLALHIWCEKEPFHQPQPCAWVELFMQFEGSNFSHVIVSIRHIWFPITTQQ